jgi:hypothetical protein
MTGLESVLFVLRLKVGLVYSAEQNRLLNAVYMQARAYHFYLFRKQISKHTTVFFFLCQQSAKNYRIHSSPYLFIRSIFRSRNSLTLRWKCANKYP